MGAVHTGRLVLSGRGVPVAGNACGSRMIFDVVCHAVRDRMARAFNP